MASPFSYFDYPYPVYWTASAADGHYDPTTNAWVGPSAAPVLIKGHFASYGGAERGRFESQWSDRPDAGVIEVGTRRFFTESPVKKGDLVQAYLDQAGTEKTMYRVLAIVKTQTLMTGKLGFPARYEVHLKEVPQ